MPKDKLDARLLVVTVSPDASAQYVPVMNCIFSAQKLSVPVDACVLADTDSLLLQQVRVVCSVACVDNRRFQATSLTNGIYFKPPTNLQGLIQHMIVRETCLRGSH